MQIYVYGYFQFNDLLLANRYTTDIVINLRGRGGYYFLKIVLPTF